jgi:ABC-2 type transport system permease protein
MSTGDQVRQPITPAGDRRPSGAVRQPTGDARRPAGVIHDIGYQRYTGVRLGAGYAARSLYTHGVRTVFGLGRGPKSKVFPWFSAGVLMLIAVVSVAVRARTGVVPITYLQLPRNGILLVLLFLATAAPELVSRDLRNQTLPLYFSRPIHRIDYAVAKYAALATGIFVVLAAPMTVMFLGGAFSLNTAHLVWHEFTDYLGGLLWALILAIVYAPIALLIASLLRRSAVATAVIAGSFILTTAIGAAIGSIINGPNGQNIGRLFSPIQTLEGLKDWMFRVGGNGIGPGPGAGPGPGVVIRVVGNYGPAYLIVAAALTVLAVAGLLFRYRRVSV